MLFTFIFYLQPGLVVDDSLGMGYNNMGFISVFLCTLQEALGNFGTVTTTTWSDTVLEELISFEYNVFWVIMVFIMLIIYTNFLIASVSDTYENVTESQKSTFSKI